MRPSSFLLCVMALRFPGGWVCLNHVFSLLNKAFWKSSQDPTDPPEVVSATVALIPLSSVLGTRMTATKQTLSKQIL